MMYTFYRWSLSTGLLLSLLSLPVLGQDATFTDENWSGGKSGDSDDPASVSSAQPSSGKDWVYAEVIGAGTSEAWAEIYADFDYTGGPGNVSFEVDYDLHGDMDYIDTAGASTNSFILKAVLRDMTRGTAGVGEDISEVEIHREHNHDGGVDITSTHSGDFDKELVPGRRYRVALRAEAYCRGVGANSTTVVDFHNMAGTTGYYADLGPVVEDDEGLRLYWDGTAIWGGQQDGEPNVRDEWQRDPPDGGASGASFTVNVNNYVIVGWSVGITNFTNSEKPSTDDHNVNVCADGGTVESTVTIVAYLWLEEGQDVCTNQVGLEEFTWTGCEPRTSWAGSAALDHYWLCDCPRPGPSGGLVIHDFTIKNTGSSSFTVSGLDFLPSSVRFYDLSAIVFPGTSVVPEFDLGPGSFRTEPISSIPFQRYVYLKYTLTDSTTGVSLNSWGAHLVPQAGIPTVSEWGMVALAVLVLSAGTAVLMRRRVAPA